MKPTRFTAHVHKTALFPCDGAEPGENLCVLNLRAVVGPELWAEIRDATEAGKFVTVTIEKKT